MKLYYFFLSLFILIVSCNQTNKMLPYYYSENFALLKINQSKDSIDGSVFWINRKDSTQLKGVVENDVFLFKSYRNNVADSNFSYEGYIKEKQFIVIRTANHSDRRDTIIFNAVTQTHYNSVLKKKLAPPILETLKRDTIIDNYKFELLVEDWNPETFYGNTIFTIKDKTSNEILQTIKSDSFHFNHHLYFDYIDMNFDNIKDLVFFNGFNGGYGSQTFDYYLYNKKERKFILNEQLAEIASGLGIEVDRVNKRIISYEKSGCCWHQQKAFKFQNDKLIKIKSMTIDDSHNVIVKSKMNGKWKTEKKHFPELTAKQSDSIYKSF